MDEMESGSVTTALLTQASCVAPALLPVSMIQILKVSSSTFYSFPSQIFLSCIYFGYTMYAYSRSRS